MPFIAKIKKLSVFILFTIVIVGNTFSITIIDNCILNGVVKDGKSGESLPFASIQLISQTDNSISKGVLTDVDGNYIITNISSGKYKLIASYMGYNKSEVIVDIQTKKSKHNFLLLQKEFSLEEIEIKSDKTLVENSIEKTTVNIGKNKTLTGGTAVDAMQTLPSVDIDIDGNIHYRGSDRVIILLNGERSEIVKSLDQIPADQIEKIELINNPSVKYQSEGMSGIINIVLKSGSTTKNKTSVMLNLGYPETLGGNIGYSGGKDKTTFFVNAGFNHKTKFQTKEHLRENYENPIASDYYQYDRQDENLNSVFINTNLGYAISKKQQIGFSIIGSKKFNSAYRTINYKTLNKSGSTETDALKEIDITLDNYTIDGNVNYRYNFKKTRQFLKANIHYSIFDQLHRMNNEYFTESIKNDPELQNTVSKQLNENTDFSLDYSHPVNDSILFETGYNYNAKDLLNDFYSESYNYSLNEWIEDTVLTNKFNYIQQINAAYLNMNLKLKFFKIQAGIRAEYTHNKQNSKNKDEYFNLFPSVNLSRRLNDHLTFYVGYNRRINRPTIKMLNPFTDEYADVLNMHKGNPDLKPEYVNSYEIGNNYVFDKFSGSASVYFRDIDQAISRVKSAADDSALIVTFMNLDKAKLLGGELALLYKPFKWWSINIGGNLFYTNLKGEYDNNYVDKSQFGWNASVFNKFKFSHDFGLQLSAYYRSELPSVMGTYIARYYMDFAVSKKILKKKGQVVFKISDVFNTYFYGLDLEAIDANNYHYRQTNRRKNESRYFILSFIYNINGKDQKNTKKNEKFFLEGFDK